MNIKKLHIETDDDVRKVPEILGWTDREEVSIESLKDYQRRIREEGDKALFEITMELDNVDISENMRIEMKHISEARESVEIELANALKSMIKSARHYHKMQKSESWFIDGENGFRTGQVIRPIDRVGIYVPGGLASYPSSLIMAAVPAQIAEVENICICSPPGKEGIIQKEILFAAGELGIEEIYAIGGSQAIFAMTYGTETIERVDKIVGPGNQYVEAAKKMVYGIVGIDFPAGPSEIVIIADEAANHEYAAYDMVAQSEHGPSSRAVLITDSEALSERVLRSISIVCEDVSRKETIVESLEKNGAIIIARDIAEAIEISNLLAPEHVELMIADFVDRVGSVRSAGTVLLGPDTPAALSDYAIGSNHILPTGSAAKYASALGVYDFERRINVVFSNHNANIKLSKTVCAISEAEGLNAHGESMKKRL